VDFQPGRTDGIFVPPPGNPGKIVEIFVAVQIFVSGSLTAIL
jgi:hypothetical protein